MTTTPKQPVSESERLAYTVPQACHVLSISRTSLYELINAGTLRTVKLAGRRLIPRTACEAVLAGTAA